MVLKKELTGTRLKKDLGIYKCHQRWHNKNKTGGNFGINLITDPRIGRPNFELTGQYNTRGEVTSLKFGRLWQPGFNIDLRDLVYEELVALIKSSAIVL